MALNLTQYELVFQAPGLRPFEPGTMRISITSDFEAPEHLLAARAQQIALTHMGPEWKRAGLVLLDIRQVEESQVSMLDGEGELKIEDVAVAESLLQEYLEGI